MALLVEIAGTDRTDDVRHSSLQVEMVVQRTGALKMTARDNAMSWRPSKLDTVEVWEPAVSASGSVSSGSATFTSTGLTAAHQHVRIPGAGPGGSTLRASLLSVTPGVSGTLDVEASATVSGATCLMGTARFFGNMDDPSESRTNGAPGTRNFPLTATSLFSVLQQLFPRSSRPSETLYDRLSGLVSDTGADDHGIRVYWPQSAVARRTEDGTARQTEDGTPRIVEDSDEGTTLEARDYDGRRAFADVLVDLAVEDGGGRTFLCDVIGRIRMQLPSAYVTPQAITSSMMVLPDGVEVAFQGDYFNRVVYHYGPSLAAYEVVDDTTEQAALGGRVFEHVAEDTDCPDAATAQARAQVLLDEHARRDRYQIKGIVLQDQEGFEPGQFGDITISERNVSGEHFVEAVTAVYMGLSGLTWRYQLTATNGQSSMDYFLDYWDEAIGASA